MNAMATSGDAGNKEQSCVAFPSRSGNNRDRTSIYSVQSAHSAQSAQSGSQQYQPRTSTTSTSAQVQAPAHLRPPYLPFRRISLPSLPTVVSPALLQQQRGSIASFDSLPEEGAGTGSGSEGMGVTLVPKNQDHRAQTGAKVKAKRPISIEGLSNTSVNVNRRIGSRRGAMSMHANSKLPSLPKLSKTSTPTLKDISLDDPLLVKRRKIIKEFYETEKAYVDGLDLIYEHFLLPLLNSLTSDSTPLLDRAVLTTVFSNFIDIWNLHKAFLNELTALFYPSQMDGIRAGNTEPPPPSAVSPAQEVKSAEKQEFPLNPPPLSPVLIAHFPYLSLYTPFITSFPTTISALNTLITPPPRWASSSYSSPSKPTPKSKARSNSQDSSAGSGSGSGANKFSYDKRFAEWVAKQEKDPRCGRLKLRDWMLTIVQRCPRYLLLLKDLIECTPGPDDEVEEEDGSEAKPKEEEKERQGKKWSREATKEEEKERKQLQSVHGLVSKITLSLNTSLQMHSQTLSLLALQRATPNLPFQLIEPGRILLRRGPLIQIERSSPPREREFLLFSDCLVWLVGEEAERREKEWSLNLADFDLDGGIEAAREGLSALWSSFGLSSGAMNSNTSLGVEEDNDVTLTHDAPARYGDQVSPTSAILPKVRPPAVVRTRSRSEGEVAMMQNHLHAQAQAQVQAEASNASGASGDVEESGVNAEDDVDESSLHTKMEDEDASTLARSKLTPTHKSHFARINKGSHLHLHLNKSKGGALYRYTSSAGSSPSHPRHHSASAYPHARSRHFNSRSRPSTRYSPSSSRRNTAVGGEERWLFKGRIELVDLEVVVPPDLGVENNDDEEGEGEDGLGWRWEILSPDGSFVLYAASARERTEWTSLIRQAKSQILVSLNAQNPNSTLTSSVATQHLRRSLQALPFRPGDVRMLDDTDTEDEEEEENEDEYRYSVASVDSGNGGSIENVRREAESAHILRSGKDKGKKSPFKDTKNGSKKQQRKQKPVWYNERRSRVEHWVPAIWIPDEKAEGCMRCGKSFGWRRRRHHCRLCGRCVCAGCSERTFFISDTNAKDPASSKPARACNECYETVFPLVEPPEEETAADDSTVRARPRPPHFPLSDPTSASSSVVGLSTALHADTITSSDLPSWMPMSVPSLPLASSSSSAAVSGTGVGGKGKEKELSGPAALMAIDRKRYSYGKELDNKRRMSVHSGNSGGKERFSRDSGVMFDLDEPGDERGYERTWVDEEEDGSEVGTPRREERDARDTRNSRVKMRSPPSRPRSYHQILEDFNSVAIEASAADEDAGMEEQQFLQNRFNVSSPLEEMIESEEEVDGQEGEDSSAISTSSVTSSSKHHTLHSHSSPASSSISLSTSPPRPQPFMYRKGPLSGVLISERKEDTVRRHKRFSLPAVALQTTSVLTRTQSVTQGLDAGLVRSGGSVEIPESGGSSGEGISGLGLAGRSGASKLSPGVTGGSYLPGMPHRTKRFSSVLGGRQGQGHGHGHGHRNAHPISVSHAHGRSEMVGESGRGGGHEQDGTDLRRGVAAGKLNELLGKNRG